MVKLILPALHLFGLLAFLVYKSKGSFFAYVKGRHQIVYDGLNRSKAQAADAAAKRKEIEARIGSLEIEKSKIFADWKEKERAHIDATKQSSERVIAQMRREAEQNKKILSDSLGEEALKTFRRTVLAQAEAKIKQKLTADVHAGINKKFIEELSKGAGA